MALPIFALDSQNAVPWLAGSVFKAKHVGNRQAPFSFPFQRECSSAISKKKEWTFAIEFRFPYFISLKVCAQGVSVIWHRSNRTLFPPPSVVYGARSVEDRRAISFVLSFFEKVYVRNWRRERASIRDKIPLCLSSPSPSCHEIKQNARLLTCWILKPTGTRPSSSFCLRDPLAERRNLKPMRLDVTWDSHRPCFRRSRIWLLETTN